MASPNTIILTDANFDQEVLKSSTPVLVDFWAVHCGPCKMLAPTIDELADEYKDKAKVAKFEITDTNRAAALKYRIDAIPFSIVFKNGQPAGAVRGLQNKRAYKAALDQALGG